MSAYAQLKKNRAESHKKLVESLQSDKSGGFQKDERIYYPERDAQGNGYAVIRFLPVIGKANFVKTFSHGFQQNGWMIEECPTTIGGACPICENNNEHWNDGTEAGKDIARARKRKVSYHANIVVVRDPKNPENEGKAFLYKFGAKIFDMIDLAARPKFDVETPVDAFSIFEDGADFELKIMKVKGQTNYDTSGFKSAAELKYDEETVNSLMENVVDLSEFKDPSRYKSYDELNKRFVKVTGERVAAGTAESVGKSEDAPKTSKATPEPASKSDEKVPEKESVVEDASEEELDPMAFFRDMAAAKG